MKRRIALCVFLVCALSRAAYSRDTALELNSKVLVHAQSKQQVVAWGKAHSGFGLYSYTTIKKGGKEVLIAWFNPYSGRLGLHIYMYARDANSGGFDLVMTRYVDKVGNLAVGLDRKNNILINADTSGKLPKAGETAPKTNLVLDPKRTLLVQPLSTATLGLALTYPRHQSASRQGQDR